MTTEPGSSENDIGVLERRDRELEGFGPSIGADRELEFRVGRVVDANDPSIGELTLDRILQGLSLQEVVVNEGLGDEVVRGATVDQGGGSTAGKRDLDVYELSTEVSTEVGIQRT